MLIFAALPLESFAGYRPRLQVSGLLMKAGWIPEEVRES